VDDVADVDALRLAKAARRAEVRSARRAMSSAERAARSAVLVARIRAEPAWSSAEVALAFHPFGNEPDIEPLLGRGPPRVLLPRVEGRHLVFAPWGPGEPLATSRFGVPEPTADAADPATASVALVPGLCFDLSCHRLGYGAGFYDRALARLPPSVTTIGLCYAHELVTAVPHGDNDVPVHLVLTDEG
jgi:5-formyltetrahydrofolate cyclo-ligase